MLLIWLYSLAIAILIGAALNAAVRLLWPVEERPSARARAVSWARDRMSARGEDEETGGGAGMGGGMAGASGGAGAGGSSGAGGTVKRRRTRSAPLTPRPRSRAVRCQAGQGGAGGGGSGRRSGAVRASSESVPAGTPGGGSVGAAPSADEAAERASEGCAGAGESIVLSLEMAAENRIMSVRTHSAE